MYFFLLLFNLFFRHAGEYESCQQQCQKVISADISNEEATIMLSEVMFLTPNPDPIASVKPLLMLLTEYPNSYKGKKKQIKQY